MGSDSDAWDGTGRLGYDPLVPGRGSGSSTSLLPRGPGSLTPTSGRTINPLRSVYRRHGRHHAAESYRSRSVLRDPGVLQPVPRGCETPGRVGRRKGRTTEETQRTIFSVQSFKKS